MISKNYLFTELGLIRNYLDRFIPLGIFVSPALFIQAFYKTVYLYFQEIYVSDAGRGASPPLWEVLRPFGAGNS